MFPAGTETWQLGHRKPQQERQPVSFPDIHATSSVVDDVDLNWSRRTSSWTNLIARFHQAAMVFFGPGLDAIGMVGCVGNLSAMTQPRDGLVSWMEGLPGAILGNQSRDL